MAEIQNYTIDDNYVNTGIVDGVVNEKPTVINIENPSIGARMVGTLFRRKALMIDQCKLRYKPQCPVNATGIVEVRISETCVHGEAAIQARFAFPVTCPVTITYFGTAFAAGDTTNILPNSVDGPVRVNDDGIHGRMAVYVGIRTSHHGKHQRRSRAISKSGGITQQLCNLRRSTDGEDRQVRG
ncbi:hypothetical protein RHGRI_026146 [Rhododendron griersonianum]|uniref:Uncharacterized protein n=1 Tax=Rhododendron griersonianum TaxID=479676 RepID=A0AAV6IRR6_9ERIC|nr:hypothetical protein RHGRI_026146 [Rhododendron griersonianum]